MATSSAQKSFSLKSTSHADFFSQFNAIVLGDDPAVKKGKPHPDIFMEAAHRIARDPHHLKDYSKFLAFEDSPTGVMVPLL